MSNRRDFLKNISLFTAGGLLAGKAGSVNAANAALGVVDEVHAGKEIGLQIYSPKNYIKATWPLIFGR